MSSAKGKVGVFKEFVQHDDHFAHDGYDGDFGQYPKQGQVLLLKKRPAASIDDVEELREGSGFSI